MEVTTILNSSLFGICLAGVCLMAVSTAAYAPAAEERMAYIQEKYGVHVDCDEHGARYIHQQLDAIEEALRYTGTEFSHRMNDVEMAQDLTPPFSIRVSDDRPAIEPRAVGYFHITTEFSVVNLYPSNRYVPTKKDVLHEFGHVACYFCNGIFNVLDDFRAINGTYDGVFDPDRYVSRYAATNASEDFAEVFAHMILNGGDNPSTVGTDTILYQKYICMLQYLLLFLGPDSPAVQRAGAFLGIAV